MTSEGDTGGLPPVGGMPRMPEYTHFAEPTPPSEAESDEWSEPTLVQLPAETETLPAPPAWVPEPPPEQQPVQRQPVQQQPASEQQEVGPDAEPLDWFPGPEPEPHPDTAFVAEPEPVPAAAPPAERKYYYVPAGSRRPRVTYEAGSVESWHPQLVEQAADVAVSAMPIPLRVLDVGCGEGQLLAELILRVPYADLYVGLDPLPEMISAARETSDPRLSLVRGAAEALPFPDASFDLVVAALSLQYWADQSAGARELARVVADNGKVVVVEDSSRAGKVPKLLESAGLTVEGTETVSRSRLGLAHAKAFIAVP